MIKKAELKQILFPTDFSETSLKAGEVAASLAKKFDAGISLLHVIETSVYKSVFPELDIETFAESSVSKAVENRLNQYAEELIGGTSLKVDPVYQAGTVSDLVYEAINTTRANLVVTGLHGVKGFQKYFAGSNAYKIATRSAVPVISVPSSSSVEFKTILVPVVDEITSLEKIPWASMLASKFAAKVIILGIVDKDDQEQLEVVQGNVQTAASYLEKSSVKAEILFEEADNYADAVLSNSSELNADLVCIMTDRKKNATGIFPGGHANQIFNQSRIAVLTMHPETI